MTLSIRSILRSLAIFLAMIVAFSVLPSDVMFVILPIVLVVVFVMAALKSQPVAIAILLYYSMILGSWFILAAAPVTIMLARRYQRHRLKLDLNPDHIRRTSLFAMAALVATLPFLGASFGPWSQRSQSSTSRSAEPLIGESRPGEEGMLQQFARWLGFGTDGLQPGQRFDPLSPAPVIPRSLPEDEPFNWWIVVAIVAALALALVAWWLWNRRRPGFAPTLAPAPARPLARLEAIGASIGRPRQPFEGAITYGRVLADQTGDERLADAGPLVSGEVYESAFANPGVVNHNLAGIESAPPPPPPKPSFLQRISTRVSTITLTPKGLAYASIAVLIITLSGWFVLPRLGDLDADRFESGLEQAAVLPLVAEDLDYLIAAGT